MRETLKIQIEIHVDGSPTQRARIRATTREIEKRISEHVQLLCDAKEGAAFYDFTPERITTMPADQIAEMVSETEGA